MKLYYFNDEEHPITVQVNGQLKPSLTNKFGEPTIEYFSLEATEGGIFFVDAPEGTIPRVKKWSHRVLLSYVDPQVLPQEYRKSNK